MKSEEDEGKRAEEKKKRRRQGMQRKSGNAMESLT